MDDRELVRRLLARDAEAERYFFHTYRDRLCKACHYILGHQDSDAEDVTQEAFIRALKGLPKFEFKSSLFHWLFRICMNLCYNRIRKRQRLLLQIEEELEVAAGPSALEQERWKEEKSEKQAMMKLVAVQKEVLGDPCRSLLRLRDEEEKSYADIGEALKIPIGTVMSRLSRCKEALKQLVLNAMGEGTHA